MTDDDHARMPCYDCGRELRIRDLRGTQAHIEIDGGPEYEIVDVRVCPSCWHDRHGFPCPNCGIVHDDQRSAEYCCRRDEPRL